MEQFVFIVIAALVALAKWLMERKSEDGGGSPSHDRDASAPREPPRHRRFGDESQPPPRVETEEEERVRRFMEALGLPTTAQPPAQSSRPTPSQQQPRETPASPLRPAVPAETMREERRPSESAPPPPAPAPRRRPPILPVPHFPRPQGRERTAAQRKEAPQPASSHPEELEAAPLGAALAPVESISTKISLSSTLAPIAVQRQTGHQSTASRKNRGGEGTLRSELSSRGSLRRAFVMAEVLGKPKGLEGLEGI